MKVHEKTQLFKSKTGNQFYGMICVSITDSYESRDISTKLFVVDIDKTDSPYRETAKSASEIRNAMIGGYIEYSQIPECEMVATFSHTVVEKHDSLLNELESLFNFVTGQLCWQRSKDYLAIADSIAIVRSLC